MKNKVLKLLKKQNNRGAALVLVIVCMLFVGIIAGSVLMITMNNIDSVQTGIKTTDTFYSAEQAAEKVKNVLQQYGDRAMNEAYTKWLQQYAIGTKNIGTEFDGFFSDSLEEILLDTILTPTGVVDGNLTYCTFTADLKDITGSDNVSWGDVNVIVERTDDNHIKLHDVCIEFTDEEGNKSIITTDIVFGVTNPVFRINTIKGQNPYASNYAVITNSELKETSGIHSATFNGNVYAGDDITFGNHSTVTFNSARIISKGDFNVEDGSSVSIMGEVSNYGFVTYNELWVRNINLAAKNSSSSGYINLQGKCYLSDDLNMCNSSAFKLIGSKSGYYGYNASNSSKYKTSSPLSIEFNNGTPEGSSAIVINGKDAKLDLSAAEEVLIAGKAFINVSSVYGSTDSSSDRNFIVGESIAFKAQQTAYLVPGECIPSIGHNPMTAAEFESIVPSSMVSNKVINKTVFETGVIDLSRSEMNLSAYVDATQPCRPAYINYAGTNLVYLYLNFQSAETAANYFADYKRVNPELVDGRMISFGDGYIKLPTDVSKITNTGNLTSYDGTVTGSSVSIKSSNATVTSNDIVDKQSSYGIAYNGLCVGLNPTAHNNDAKVTDTIFKMNLLAAAAVVVKAPDGITELYQVPVESNITVSGDYKNTGFAFYDATRDDEHKDIPDDIAHSNTTLQSYRLYLARDKVTITTNTTGIVICGGSVEIMNGAQFKGLIICEGDVIISGTNTTLTADPNNTGILLKRSKVLDTLSIEHQTQGALQGGADDENNASDMISVDFENWRKNQ